LTDSVGGEYRHAAITIEHLIAEGRTWGLASAPDLARETLTTALQLATTQPPHKQAHAGLPRDIAGFASNLLAGRAAGARGNLR
jgi:serine/threonine-protein kinase HipA